MTAAETNVQTKKILIVGDSEKDYSPILLIKALKHSNNKDNIHAIFVGFDSLSAEIECKLKRSGIKSFEICPNKAVSLESLVNSSDICIHPSKYQNCNNLKCAFLSKGVIPILSDKSCQIDLDECSYFESGDYHDLARKIDFIIEHPSFTRELAKRYMRLATI